MQKFKELGLSAELEKALAELGITEPTTIQEKAIPTLLKDDHDFIGLAQTGTGKTAAFGLPLLELINEESKVTQGLIIAPTRELAVQTAESLKAFSKYRKKVVIDVVYGGTPIVPHLKQLKKHTPMILVATPGRLIDLVERKALRLDSISHVVLDEADEILNMGFKEDLDKILSFTPAEKFTWLFSATMPAGIRRIVKQYMHEPKEVTVSGKEKVNKNIQHNYVLIRKRDRTEVLKKLIDSAPEFYGLVFCRTKIDTQEVAEHLMSASYQAGAIHGDMSQQQRNLTMKRFKSGMLKVLVATDVAARGIDVDDLTHVIHYALPDDTAFYTHRSGRTARAGKKGQSIILLTPDTERKLKWLKRDLGIDISKMTVPSNEEIWANKLDNWAKRIIENEPKNLSEKLLNRCKELFNDLDKEDLLARLLSLEMDTDQSKEIDFNLSGKEKDWSDSRDKRKSNRKDRDRRDRKDRGDRRDRPDRDQGDRNNITDGHRFYINMGSFDHLDRHKLLNLISDKTSISKKKIGNIELGKKHSYFEIDKNSSRTVAKSFKDFNYRGRQIRVNRDGGKK